MFRFVVIITLIPLTLTGCLGNYESMTSFSPFSFVYEGEDGSQITGEVTGFGYRWDPWAREQYVLLVGYTYHAPSNQGIYHFEDAIDPATGLIVSQIAFCGTIGHGESQQPCNRATFIGSAFGTPGLFGLGPAWAGYERDIIDDGKVFRIPGGETAATFDITAEGACRTVTLRGFAPSLTVPWVPIGQKIVDCGQGVPERFKTSHDPVFAPRSSGEHILYRLVGVAGSLPAHPTIPGIIPPRPNSSSLQEPYYVSGLNPGTTFGLEEAHQAALKHSAKYHDLFNKSGAMVLEYEHFYDSSAYLVNNISRTESQSVVILAASGQETLEITIKRSNESVVSVEQVTYGIKEEKAGMLPEEIKHRREQVSFPVGLEMVRQFHNLPVVFEDVGMFHQTPVLGESVWLATAPRHWRTSGYVLAWYFFDPLGENAGFIPYHATVDGVTGGVESIDVPLAHKAVARQ